MDISQSKIKTWRTCRRQYYYKYIMKLTKKFKPQPLLRGTIVHDMLESYYTGKDPWKSYKANINEHKKLLRINPEEYGDLAGDIKKIMKGYFDYYKGEKIKPIHVEYDFRTKLFDKVYLIGKIDMIAKEKTQKLNITVEHKVHNKIPDGSMVPYANLQSAEYNWVIKKELGIKIDAMMWNYLSGKVPTIPEVLKNGNMSRRNTGTTWAVYRDALDDAGLKIKDYKDMKESLEGNEANFYQRKLVPLNPTLIENVHSDTIITAKEISKLGGIDTTRNLDRHCEFCEFKNLCIAQLKGLDDNYIIKSDFTTRKKK